MLQITYSAGSPFVRKVRLAAAIKNVSDKIAFVGSDAADDERLKALRRSNPLEKIPAGRLPDGTLIYDSHVICEFIDSLADQPRLFPPNGPQRWKALTLAALSDGLTEAAVLIMYESRFRPPELYHQGWVDRQQQKIEAALGYLEAGVPEWTDHPGYGHISLACALGYLDVRQEGHWRSGRPNLVSWLERFAVAVPAWRETAPV